MPVSGIDYCPTPPGMTVEFLDAAEGAGSAAIDKFVYDYETFLMKLELRNVAR